MFKKNMEELLYRVKRLSVDIVLLIILIFMSIFCCDRPVYKGFELFDHTGKMFWYDFCMAIITAILIHFIHRLYLFFTIRRKYERIVYNQCKDIAGFIKEIIRMIVGTYEYEEITKEYLQDKIKEIDFHAQGAKYYEKNEELILCDAIKRVNELLLEKIDNIIELPFMDKDLIGIFYRIKTLAINEIWREIWENDIGHLKTVKEKREESYGGIYWHCDRTEEIVIGILEYIDILRSMNVALKVIYGYTCEVKL